ncbi:Glycosylphosphatidylinositol anchor attachment 1 protein [Phytophthora cinnamomi]|uniref:Glycosylphosphatidylinositol anchor attachment 1 protein n=1 Tax=Phytophthora cinnamomi TaxID=4785 RepID=UPI003559E4D3|nr:Glycosylphosphatidylinositol anchor attachment 1 protein [Phytophthora cinnamomi]
MLRGKLSRRNQVLEVIRRAYYRDVIIIKEELRQYGGKLNHMGSAASLRGEMPKLQRTPSRQIGVSASVDGGLSSVPSVDLREALPLFAPSETMLQVHPCETCGGHLELVHGESKELKAARQEMARASKGEQQMRTVVHRMRSEAKQMEEVNDALQQRVKALMKENAYTLEQLQAARKMEREQKVIIAGMRSKLQLTQATQDEIDRLASEYKDVKQQLIRSNHDRDIFSASNNHLKEELAEVTKALHVVKVEKAQIESDFGTNYYRLQEETKKAKQLAVDLAARDEQLKEKNALCTEQQQSLTSLKEELVSTLQRFEQTKRHLEDQLIEEERAREEMQEQNLEFRRLNKKLVRDLENMHSHSMDMDISSTIDEGEISEKHENSGSKKERSQRPQAANQAMALRNNMRKKLDDLQYQLEWALMRENDLAGMLAHSTSGATSKTPGLKRILSRMPSKTVITRLPIPEDEEVRSTGSSEMVTTEDTTHSVNEKEGARPSKKSLRGSQGGSEQSDTSLKEEDESQEALEINEKNFEAYHKEVARMLTEVKEGKDKIAKQQKVITELERKNHVITDRLEESKLSIEALTGSVNALKMRLNQDSAGAAEMMEAMMRQIDEGKRDQQYEVERSAILMSFLRQVSESVHEMMELQRKKREVRRKVLMDKAMKKFSIMCHNRAELIGVEMQKMRSSFERMREDLDQAENKIDSDQLHIRTLEAEIAKLRLTVEMGKNTLGKLERTLKQTTDDLNDYTMRFRIQGEEITILKGEHEKLQEDQNRLTLLLFEKTKAWQKEINTNDKCNQRIEKLEEAIGDIKAEREILQKKLDEIEALAEFRRQTNRSVEISAIPETTESEIQTDRWKPQGLILRQRNGPDRMPQRYLGKASVMIHCPELSRPVPSVGMDAAPVPRNQDLGLGALSSPNGIMPPMVSDTDEHVRGMLELKIYPSVKAGGRQIKTSYASSRPKALSRLYLSSDGVSQKYIAPTARGEGRGSFDGRPSTVL